jgi:hypothetical protein
MMTEKERVAQMEIGVIAVLVSIWVLVMAGAAIVALLPAAKPGHEGDVIPLVRRRRRQANERPAA